MTKKLLFGITVIILFSVWGSGQDGNDEHKIQAEQLFRSVYGGKPSNVDNLVGDDIVSSYPIFEELFNKKAIRGREAYNNFVLGFNKRWKETRITIHEAVAEGDKVVLVWSFSGKMTNGEIQNETDPENVQSWGGITLYRFDESGKIVEEVGEESTPGPFHRLDRD